MEDSRSVLSITAAWNVSFVESEGNQITHYLAKAAIGLNVDPILIEEVPNFLLSLVDVDFNSM